MPDRIVELRVKGLRSLADVRLKLGGLTVLIGENGAGKSTLIEALELTRKAAAPSYVHNLANVHGGLPLLLREGASQFEIGIRIEGDEGPIEYQFAVGADGHRIIIASETMDLGPAPGHEEPLHVIIRNRSTMRVFDQASGQLVVPSCDSGTLLVSAFGALPPQRAIARTVAVLERIEVHVPFDVRAFWICKERGWGAPLRDTQVIQPAASLTRIGDNLASAFHALKNDFGADHWRETMEYVKLGLSDDIESINTQTTPGGAHIAVTLERRGLHKQVPAAAMADGTLAYLAFVAMFRLGKDRTLLAYDEPDLHLHPALLVRVLSLFETLSRQEPVVLATQSDRLLDALSDPLQSAVLCRLVQKDPKSAPATKLVRPNRDAFERWTKRYRGLGSLRSEGFEDLVMSEADP